MTSPLVQVLTKTSVPLSKQNWHLCSCFWLSDCLVLPSSLCLQFSLTLIMVWLNWPVLCLPQLSSKPVWKHVKRNKVSNNFAEHRFAKFQTEWKNYDLYLWHFSSEIRKKSLRDWSYFFSTLAFFLNLFLDLPYFFRKTDFFNVSKNKRLS